MAPPPVAAPPRPLVDPATADVTTLALALLEDPEPVGPDGLAELARRPPGTAPTLPAMLALADLAVEAERPLRQARLLAVARQGLRDDDAWARNGLDEADAWRRAGHPEIAAAVLGELWRRLPERPMYHPNETVWARHRALIGLWAVSRPAWGPSPELPSRVEQQRHLVALLRTRRLVEARGLVELWATVGWFDPALDQDALTGLETVRAARRKRKTRPAPDQVSPMSTLLGASVAWENALVLAANEDRDGGYRALLPVLGAALEPEDAARLRLDVALLALDTDRGQEVLAHVQEGLDLGPSRPLAVDLGWVAALQHLKDGDREAARVILDGQVELDLPRMGAFTHSLSHAAPAARALYWLARIDEWSGDADGATRRFLAVAERYPLSVYHLFAIDGLRRLGGEAPGLLDTLPPVAHDAACHGPPLEGPVGQVVGGLLQARQLDVAVADLEDATRYDADPHVAAALVHTLRHGGRTVAAVQAAWLHYRGRSTFPGGMPLLDDIDPVEHLPEVKEAARAVGLDPWWVLALIRQESRFQPGVCSGSGACGMMQLKSKTASLVASRNHISYSGEEALKDPAVNMALGCALLEDLEEMFGADPVRAVAAYNAGGGAVRRWALDGWSTDLFFELMKDRRTRAYTAGILGRYALYAAAFDHGQTRNVVVAAARREVASPPPLP